MSVGSLEPKFFAALCEGLGFPEWADGKILQKNTAEVKEAFRKTFRTRTREEWTAVFEKLDACVEPVLSLEEASRDAHLSSRGMWPEVPLPQIPGKTVRQMGCPVRLSETPPEYRHAGYPEGWHTEAFLRGMGYTDEQIREMSGED